MKQCEQLKMMIFPNYRNSVKSQFIHNVPSKMEGDAIPIVQHLQLSEVAELRWDDATKLIRLEGAEGATINQ